MSSIITTTPLLAEIDRLNTALKIEQEKNRVCKIKPGASVIRTLNGHIYVRVEDDDIATFFCGTDLLPSNAPGLSRQDALFFAYLLIDAIDTMATCGRTPSDLAQELKRKDPSLVRVESVVEQETTE